MKTRTSINTWLSISIFLLAISTSAAAKIIYVDDSAPPNGGGTSWADAFNYLQDALDAASNGDEIYVAEGIYKPDTSIANPGGTGDREATFQLTNGVGIYGGFPSGGGIWETRDPNVYETILSGDLNNDDISEVSGSASAADDCSQAEQVYLGFYYEDSTDGATNDGLSSCNTEYHDYSYDRWYKYTADIDRTVGFSLKAPGCIISVYTDCPGRPENELICGYHYAAVDAEVGQTYYIRVASYTSVGDFMLQVSLNSDNSYHVVNGSGTDETAVMNGFTIKEGNANADFDAWDDTRGAGIFIREGGPKLTNCRLIGNSSVDGGAMYSSRGNPILKNCIFSGNTANSGGAISIWQGNITLDRCKLSKNWSAYGGGAIDNNGNMTLTNCIFTGNESRFGGGMSNGNWTEVALKGCVFSENIAKQGAAISNTGYLSYQTFSDCLFVNNQAEWCGGGMYNQQDISPPLIRCKFIQNTAAGHGGAISNGSFCSPTIINCIFNGNSVGGYGGAISNFLNNPTLINCGFSGNSADGEAGAMSCMGSGATLINCTFAGNSAPSVTAGISLWLFPNSLYVTNSIFWDGGDEIRNNDGDTITVRYSDVQGGWPGEGNADLDPLFADADGPDNIFGTADDNLQLVAGSPCINTGDLNYTADGKVTMQNEFRQAYDENVNQLAKENIDISTIVVKDDDRISLFTEGEDYVIIEDGNRVLLDIIFEAVGAPPNFELLQDYYIDYVFSIPSADVQIDLAGNPRIIGSRIDMGAYEFSMPAMIKVAMKLTPRRLNCCSKGKWLKAHFVLPEGFSVEDVDANTPAVIEPYGIESYKIKVLLNDEGLVRVEATFRRSDLCSSITSYDENTEVMVIGRLTSGQYFYGTDIIKVTDRAFEALDLLVSHWLQEDCSKPDWCGGADLNRDSVVNFVDFAMLDGCCFEVVRK